MGAYRSAAAGRVVPSPLQRAVYRLRWSTNFLSGLTAVIIFWHLFGLLNALAQGVDWNFRLNPGAVAIIGIYFLILIALLALRDVVEVLAERLPSSPATNVPLVAAPTAVD